MNVYIDMYHLIHQILTDEWVTPGMLMKQNGKYRYYERQVQFILDYPILYLIMIKAFPKVAGIVTKNSR